MRMRPAREEDLKGPLFEPLFAKSPSSEADEKANREVRHKLLESSRVRIWDEDSLVLFEDDPGDFLLVLLKGRAKVILEAEEGRQELILAFIEPFAIVGELAPLDAAPRSASVIALEKAEFLRIPGSSFLAAISAKPELAIGLIRHLSRIVRNVDERLRTISMFEADGQTVRALFLFCEKREDRATEVVLTGFPQIAQIAQMLGRRRETISNALSELETGNYLKAIRSGNSLQQVSLTRKAVNAYLKGLHPPIP